MGTQKGVKISHGKQDIGFRAIEVQQYFAATAWSMLSTMPAWVAQLDIYPTGDQEVVVSTPRELATFFHGDYEIFSTVSISLLLIQEGQL